MRSLSHEVRQRKVELGAICRWHAQVPQLRHVWKERRSGSSTSAGSICMVAWDLLNPRNYQAGLYIASTDSSLAQIL